MKTKSIETISNRHGWALAQVFENGNVVAEKEFFVKHEGIGNPAYSLAWEWLKDK